MIYVFINFVTKHISGRLAMYMTTKMTSYNVRKNVNKHTIGRSK